MAAVDKFGAHASGLSSPGAEFAAVAPSNGVDLPVVTRALYVGTGGNVSVVGVSGSTAVFRNVASGQVLPIRCARVNLAGTTATDIVAIW